MHGYVINLRRRTDRRRQFEALNGNRPGLQLEFVEAVDGRDVTPAQMREEGFPLPEGAPIPEWLVGAVGSAISHIRLARQCAVATEPFLVFEDDACLPIDFVTEVEAAMAELPVDWDILVFGYNTDAELSIELPGSLHARIAFDERWKDLPGFFERYAKEPGSASRVFRLATAHGSCAFLMSPAGARKLANAIPESFIRNFLEASKKGTWHAYDSDMRELYRRPDFSAWCFFPPLVRSPNDHATSDVVDLSETVRRKHARRHRPLKKALRWIRGKPLSM